MLTGVPPTVSQADLDIAGSWQVFISTRTHGLVEVTQFRGFTTNISQLVTTDPFGPAMATLDFPAVTMLDALGEGDLHWWRPGNDVAIVWTADPGVEVARTSLRWEGYIAGDSTSFEDSGGTVQLLAKGALKVVDNTLAMPAYPQRPIPFEHAIRMGLDRARSNGARIGALRIDWPEWWTTRYSANPNSPGYMVPMFVQDGERWTAMVTRETGQRDQMLSSYIQGLLSSMHTDRGQFTIGLDEGRIPVLRHRDRINVAATCEIDLVTPGVSLNLNSDYETRANVIYGTGRSIEGIAFSNMQYGLTSGMAYYTPFAAHHSVYPVGGPKYDPDVVRREIAMQFYEGMNPEQATAAAAAYQRRFATSGDTGTLTLKSDPYVMTDFGPVTMLRHTIVAGDVIAVRHYRGRAHGVLLHVTQANYSPADGSMTLTVDTMFRDQLTSTEVRLRGRDALTVNKLLTVGSYSPNIRDQLLPWGPSSGYIPTPATAMFSDTVPLSPTEDIPFPWDTLTQARPPKDPSWTSSYVRIGPADPVSLANNWNTPKSEVTPCLIQLSQAGSISLLQIMAVDRDGNRMAVPFHVGFYLNESTAAPNMPLLDANGAVHPLFGVDKGPYPFFPGAFEQIQEDGTLPPNGQTFMPTSEVGMLAAYGSGSAPAGYYPSTLADGGKPTGLLSVEGAFTYDVAGFDKDWNAYENTNTFSSAGIIAVLLYCDSMWDEATQALVPRNKDVYFIGRAFRTPPGNG